MAGPRAYGGKPKGKPKGTNTRQPVKLVAPTSPPPQYYDPGIDAQIGASQRGLGDLFSDTSLARIRGADDLSTATGDVNATRASSLADLLSGYQRGQDDSQLGEQRLGQDHTTALTNLTRQFSQLGGQQAQQASQSGLNSAGIFAQAAAKRQGNETIAQAPIDTSYNRSLTDLFTARDRASQDYATNVGRTNAAADEQLGKVNLGLGRQQTDWQTGIDRAQRENTMFGQDANAQKWFQAKQAGYVAPAAAKAKPKKKAKR